MSTDMVRRIRLVREVLERGIVRRCPRCGPAVVSAYPTVMLQCAVEGTVTLDADPTHLCVPPAPVPSTRHNPMARINADVTCQWTPPEPDEHRFCNHPQGMCDLNLFN